MQLKELRSRASDAEKLLKALASEPRLMILCELLDGERTVTDLQQAVGLAMSAVSQHLAKLREAEIVATRREAQTIRYSLRNEAARALMTTLYEVFCRPGLGVKQPRRRKS